MKAFGLARIGKDMEMRFLPNGDPVGNVSLAFTWRSKGEKQTQWVEGTMWGKRAESLAPYMLKGGLVSVTLEDVHIETYQGKNGEGTKLSGKITDVELAGGGEPKQEAPARQSPGRPAPSRAAAPDEDIPFANPLGSRAACLAT